MGEFMGRFRDKETIIIFTTNIIIKAIVGLLMIILTLQVMNLPVLAAPICRTIQSQDICILSIKRSAKNFWEYRAAVSTNGKRGPQEVYNCRSRYKTLRNGSIEYFNQDSIGSLICKIYKPTGQGMPRTLTID